MQHTVIALVLAIIIIGGGGYLLIQNQNAPEADGDKMMEKGDAHDHDHDDDHDHEHGDAMEKKDGEAMMEEGDKGSMGEAMEDGVVFNLTGKNFSFSESELRVKQGQKVTVNFTSESGFHDWVVDEFNAATAQVNSGDSTSVTFVADQTGSFEYYCSVGNHRQLGMVGTLIVE